MKKKINVALIGSNFGINGYLPVLKKIKKIKLLIICSKNIKAKNSFLQLDNKIKLENNWKKVFTKEIDLIILAVPPLIQEKILKYNLKHKKKIIFEKPITNNLSKSRKIAKILKEKKIKSEINLTYLNHPLFNFVKKFIQSKKLGKVIKYKIKWNFISYDFNKRIKSWKTDEKQGGGIKNIFLTHVFSYCEYFFGSNKLKNFQISIKKFKNLNYKNKISCELKNSNSIFGNIEIFNKKKGFQNHEIKIEFVNGYIKLLTHSKDWTKNFQLNIYDKKTKRIKRIKAPKYIKFKDGRSNQIYIMFSKFLKNPNYSNIDYCLNAEELNNKIN